MSAEREAELRYRAAGDARRSVAAVIAGVGRGRLLRVASQILACVIAACLWELLAASHVFPSEVPGIIPILRSFGNELVTGSFWSEVGGTAFVWLVSVAIATGIGVAIGILTGVSRVADALTDGVIEFLRPIPPLIYLPFVVLVLGETTKATIVLVVIAAIWPIVKHTHYGVRDVDPVLRDTGRAFCLSRWQTLRAVIVPTAGPFFATGLRISIMMGLVVTIGMEVLGTGGGLGGQLYHAEQYSEYPLMYSLAVAAGILGVVTNMGLERLERSLLSWAPAHRPQAGR